MNRAKITIAGHEFARYIAKTEGRRRDWDVAAVVINDPGDDYETVNDIHRYASRDIKLEFFDLKTDSETHRSPKSEDLERALAWYDLVKSKVDHIVVTCTAGISRSAATAFVLACSDRDPEEAAGVWNPRLHYPNKLIVRLGSDLLGKPEMLRVTDDFWAERLRRRHLKGKPPKGDD